jgi:hypothetical protein
VLCAEDFKESLSVVSFRGLDLIQKALSSVDQSIVLVGNHPVLDSILDVLNARELGDSILIGSGFTTTITVTSHIRIFLIAELGQLYDPRNPFLLPLLDQTHTTFLDWKEICPVCYQTLHPDSVVPLLELHQLWANEKGFESDPLHTNLRVLLEHHFNAWRDQGFEHPTKALSADEQARNETVANAIADQWAQSVHVVIKTRAAIHANLSLPETGPLPPEIDDSEIQSSMDLETRIAKHAVVIVKCSRFDPLHHAHFKSLLDRREPGHDFDGIIIYFGVESPIPSTVRWRVLAMEDISEYPALQAADPQKKALSYECVQTLLSQLSNSQLSDEGNSRVLLVSQIWTEIRDICVGRDGPTDPDVRDDLFPWRLDKFHAVLAQVPPRAAEIGARLLPILGTAFPAVLSGLPQTGGSLHSRLVHAIVIAFEEQIFTYLAKESDLRLYKLPATTAQEVPIKDGVEFRLPYRGSVIQEVPFLHILLPFAHRLIHNQILKFDDDERLVRAIALCADDVALRYLHHLRAYLLRILARDSTFAALGIFDTPEEETLDGQLSLFRTFAGIDYSGTLTFLFSRHAKFTYTMSTFWEHARPIPISVSFWQWHFIIEVGYAYRHN